MEYMNKKYLVSITNTSNIKVTITGKNDIRFKYPKSLGHDYDSKLLDRIYNLLSNNIKIKEYPLTLRGCCRGGIINLYKDSDRKNKIITVNYE